MHICNAAQTTIEPHPEFASSHGRRNRITIPHRLRQFAFQNASSFECGRNFVNLGSVFFPTILFALQSKMLQREAMWLKGKVSLRGGRVRWVHFR